MPKPYSLNYKCSSNFSTYFYSLFNYKTKLKEKNFQFKNQHKYNGNKVNKSTKNYV